MKPGLWSFLPWKRSHRWTVSFVSMSFFRNLLLTIVFGYISYLQTCARIVLINFINPTNFPQRLIRCEWVQQYLIRNFLFCSPLSTRLSLFCKLRISLKSLSITPISWNMKNSFDDPWDSSVHVLSKFTSFSCFRRVHKEIKLESFIVQLYKNIRFFYYDLSDKGLQCPKYQSEAIESH